MSEKGKIIKTTHIANFSEDGLETTDDGRCFVEAINNESINNIDNGVQYGIVSGGNGNGGIIQAFWTPFDPVGVALRWGCGISIDSTRKLEINPHC